MFLATVVKWLIDSSHNPTLLMWQARAEDWLIDCWNKLIELMSAIVEDWSIDCFDNLTLLMWRVMAEDWLIDCPNNPTLLMLWVMVEDESNYLTYNINVLYFQEWFQNLYIEI
jgi:hypothetical protein